MAVITIPKKITKGEELIIIPRREYERVLHALKKRQGIRSQLDQGLDEALEDVKAGRLIGPFSRAEDLIKDLKK